MADGNVFLFLVTKNVTTCHQLFSDVYGPSRNLPVILQHADPLLNDEHLTVNHPSVVYWSVVVIVSLLSVVEQNTIAIPFVIDHKSANAEIAVRVVRECVRLRCGQPSGHHTMAAACVVECETFDEQHTAREASYHITWSHSMNST